MSFLVFDDYKSQIKDYDLDDLTEYNDGARADAELRAQAEMESYLRDRFNVGTIFTQQGSQRNTLIVMYMIDLTLYHLFCTTPRQMPEIRETRYKSAIAWLNGIRKGELSADLPPNTDARGNKIIDSIFSSNPPNGFNW